MEEKEIVSFYLDNETLLGPDMLRIIAEDPAPLKSDFIVINKDSMSAMNSGKNIVIEDFEKAIVQKEKHKDVKLYSKFIEFINEKEIAAANGSDLNVSGTYPDGRADLKSKSHGSEIKGAIAVTDMQPAHKAVSEATQENVLVKDIHDRTDDLRTHDAAEKNDPQTAAQEKELFMQRHRIRILSSYTSKPRKWAVSDFVNLYNSRFKELEKILHSRQELSSLTSISRITQKKERENVSLIGVVYEKGLTKTGNIILTIEDPTGMVKVVVNKTKEDLFRLADEIQLDEVIGITGMFDNIIFANALFIPDIPLTKELKKSPEEGYFVIIADTEPGSKLFLEKEFNKFLSWLSGDIGNEKQKEIASKVRYLFIAGDLVAGVGIYPNQEFDLNIIDIYDQYKALAELLKKVPEDIAIFVCPGNHDVGRISEPQPPLSPEYAKDLLDMPNVISVSNPSMINIYAHPEQGFDGFDVMFYHGLSFVYYSEHIPTIRRSGGQKRPDLIMRYLLQRRHLAPTHTSTLYVPDPKKDPLVIDKVPDFLVTGHVHRAMASHYKNVTCINASCWTSQSDEQERRGLEAQPGRAFIVDMKTREVKIMNFLSKEDQDKEEGNLQGPLATNVVPKTDDVKDGMKKEERKETERKEEKAVGTVPAAVANG